MVLAGLAQVMLLYDPVIFGKIIDNYVFNPSGKPEDVLVKGVSFWLAIAIAIALVSRMLSAFKDYLMRMVVQKFGMSVFNDGLRQTLRLPYQEFEDQRSGETLSILQKVRVDTEKFIAAFINVLFPVIVGIVVLWLAPRVYGF